jgi:hypothetical protein
MDFLNLLRQKIMGAAPQPEQSLMGLRQAYQKHAIEAQINGQAPMSFDDFVRQAQRGPQSNMDAMRQMPQGPMSDRDAEMMRRGMR